MALPLLAVAWLSLVVLGLSRMWEYESRPGIAEATLADWPDASCIVPSQTRPTLVVFAHPRCPCTRASIAELARIISNCYGKLDAHVLFLRPHGVEQDWEQTDLWTAAAQIPGVQVTSDAEGAEAQRFSAVTSGHAFLFSHDGQLLFQGGITGSRGHEGDNAGRSAIEALLNDGQHARGKAFVFGCSLFEQADQCEVEI